MLETLLQVAEDGVRGLSPLGSRPGPVIGSIERAEALLARHPRAAYAFAAAEALLGVATAVAGTRSRGARRTAAVLGGLLLVVDAAVDATVITRRRRQADPTSNIQEIPNRSVS
ncbi:hypothetical protein [Isoptericola croceus]|uniref:hypothetical protein n=1 Tax=Isoptericola croceus TaxID=3031406 RepID=UPI0023F870AF|nr:hypothetical protein [Isoptericola croceus]